MPFRLNRTDARRPWRRRTARAALAAAIGTLALASTARAAGPYVLEVSEGPDGTGFGEVACEYKEEGLPVVEQPCEELEFATKKPMKLTPVPELGSEFVHFEGGTGSAVVCNGMTKPCSFTLEADSSVEARFDEITPALVIHTAGQGEVSCAVEGSPAELCENEYQFATEIELVPEPEEHWKFTGFFAGVGSAAVCGNGMTEPCSVMLEKDSSIEARFAPIMHQLTIAKAGSGQGAVTCNGSPCAASYAESQEVLLNATPAQGSTFAGWSGGECAGTAACLVTIESNTTVTATFVANVVPPLPKGIASVGAIAKVKSGKARVALACSGGPCAGTLKLTARLKAARKVVTIGRASFSLADGASKTVKVPLSSAAARQLKTARSLRAKASGSGLTPGAVKLKL